MGREIAQCPPIMAVNGGRWQATGRAGARRRRASCVDDDAVGADLVVIDDQSWRNELERHSAIGHPIWPSLARPPTPLESLGIHRQLHQVRARAKITRLFTILPVTACRTYPAPEPAEDEKTIDLRIDHIVAAQHTAALAALEAGCG